MEQKELRHMSTKEIAKKIRANLKKEFGKTIKFSVRKKYEGSIYVEIKSCDKKYRMTKEEFLHQNRNYKNSFETIDEYNKTYGEYFKDCFDYHTIKKEVRDKIDEIANEYNFDNSNIMTDYFDYNYFCNIGGYDIEFI